ncbi:MAG: peptidylprolyl isomerase, partial [Campylobacter sp.]|nr:peptidylprolyl isomerase [Campylobacter sp.]
RVVVKELKGDEVVIDFNHPYAGKDLLFEVELTELRDADENEELTGVAHQPHTCGCGGYTRYEHGDGGCCGGAHHDEYGGGCCGRHHHD